MYNGIGHVELRQLANIKQSRCDIMPLYLADDDDKKCFPGPVCTFPMEGDFQGANRLVIKVQKT